MQVYIYRDVERISSNYHDDGGLVIITDRDPLDAYNESVKFQKDGYGGPLRRTELPLPDNIIEAISAVERVYVFPNAGCC